MIVSKLIGYIVLQFLIVFTSRYIVRYKMPYAITIDTYFHLAYAKWLNKKNPGKNKFKEIILNHENTYPYLYHKLLSFFKNKLLLIERISSPFLDALNSCLVIFLTLSLNSDYLNLNTAFLAGLTYAFTPALFSLGWGPRAFNGTARILGQTIYLAQWILLINYVQSNEIYYLILALIFASLLFITSKFAVQAYLFLGIGVIIYDYRYIFFLITSFLLGIILTKGTSYMVLLGQVKHSKFYKIINKKFRWEKANANTKLITYLRKFRYHFQNLFKKEIRFNAFFSWFFIYERFFIHSVVVNFPILFVLIFYFDFTSVTNFNLLLMALVLNGIFLFFIINIPLFKFLGEAERYLEFILPFIVILAVIYVPTYILIIYVLMGIALLTIVYNDYFTRNRFLEEQFKETNYLFEEVQKESPSVIWPIGYSHWISLYQLVNSKWKILTFGVNLDKELIPLDEYKLIYENYIFPSIHYGKIINDYNVEYIVGSKEELNQYFFKICKLEKIPKQFKIHLESELFILYKVIK